MGSRFRESFPITENINYFNIANHCPPSISVKKAIKDFLLDWDALSRYGDEKVNQANTSFARLINAQENEIACQPNTSRGLATVSSALKLKKGSNIIINDLENWANVYPWIIHRKNGVEIKIVRGRGGAVHFNDIQRQIDDKTGVIAISHVQWLTGAKQHLRPLADLAHEHGAHLVVDGIQAAGAINIDIKKEGVDFYACGSYKWLLGPSGAGFLYVKEEHFDNLFPREFGYRAIKSHNLNKPILKETAHKMEFGEPSYLSFVGTKAGIDLILDLGIKNIEKQVLKLSERLYDGLCELNVDIVSPKEHELRSGIISFTATDLKKVYTALTKVDFALSLRSSGIRVSTGFYNTTSEVDKLLFELKKLLS